MNGELESAMARARWLRRVNSILDGKVDKRRSINNSLLSLLTLRLIGGFRGAPGERSGHLFLERS